MSALFLLLLVGGAAVLVVGNIWFLVAAFRQGIGWGLACIFVPFANVVFLIVHWQEAKGPFLLTLFGAVMLIGGAAGGGEFSRFQTANTPKVADSLPSPSPGGADTRHTPSPASPSYSTTPEPAGSTASRVGSQPAVAEPTAVPRMIEPPPGVLPPPRPADTPTHRVLKREEWAQHMDEVLWFRMKDGRTILGTLRRVGEGSVRVERSIGMGSSSFDLPLEEVREVLVRN